MVLLNSVQPEAGEEEIDVFWMLLMKDERTGSVAVKGGMKITCVCMYVERLEMLFMGRNTIEQ